MSCNYMNATLCCLDMVLYMCLKAAMTQPVLLDSCFSFHIATARYLVSLVKPDSPTACQASDFVPRVLEGLPEFLAENVQDFLLFIHRFKDHLFEASFDFFELLLYSIPPFPTSTR